MNPDEEPCVPLNIVPFPPLPVELVRYIMETTINMEWKTALSLALVSKVVNTWITPIIYHTIVFNQLPDAVDDVDVFVDILRTPRVGASPGTAVRRLVLLDIKWDASILFSCPNLEIFMTNRDLPLSMPTDVMQWPSPSHVMLVASLDYQQGRVGHPLLRKVTHLYVDYPGTQILEFIAPLSHLTHLGVGCWDNVDDRESCFNFVSHALSRPTLVSLLVQVFAEYDGKLIDALVGPAWFLLAEIEDDRLIAGPGISKESHIELMLSGISIWAHAKMRHHNWRQLLTQDKI